MIYLPKKIKVGYQKRDGTYTGKLAYVIYYDAQGKLRKEVSWDNWRDEKIEPDEYDNKPTSGFVLNKKVGDYASDWNHRKAYCRVYDPRGFEFEIDINNLLYILENTSCIKGKGLEGEFVYGWNGKDLILMPTSSPDYQQLQSTSDQINKNECIKASNLIPGHMYRTKDDLLLCYLGRFPKYTYGYDGKYEVKSAKKNFWFYKPDGKYNFEKFQTWLSFPKTTFVEDVGSDNKKYAEGIQATRSCEEFVPVDHSKTQMVLADRWKLEDSWHSYFYIKKNDTFIKVEAILSYGYGNSHQWFLRRVVPGRLGGERISDFYHSKHELLWAIEPYVKSLYLENGEFFKNIF